MFEAQNRLLEAPPNALVRDAVERIRRKVPAAGVVYAYPWEAEMRNVLESDTAPPE